MRGVIRILFITFMFSLLFSSCGGGGGSSKGSDSGGTTLTGNTFIALYIVGSDLESDGEAGTADLLELVKGYETLSSSQRNSIYVYVAFGGANKDGWRGVKYADIECIIKDSKDKKFGNDSCYDYKQVINTQNLKNMADKEAFQHFINRVNQLSANFNTRILIMWNHGGAYTGYGWDENWQKDGKTLDSKKDGLLNNDNLTIFEIGEVLKSTNSNFDIIGFDACLMASLEVALAVKDSGKYLVASEEVEPGHGWDYADVIQKIASNLDKSALDKAKLLVDSFVDNKNHEQGSGLTLSVIDLSKIDSLKNALDSIDFNNLNLNKVVLAEKTSQKYGYSVDGETLEEDYYTVDMIQFFEKSQLNNIKDKIKSVVLYNKNDGNIVSNGIAMASFSKTIDLFAENADLKSILPAHYSSGLETIKSKVEADKNPPSISPITCNPDNQNSTCLKITDNTAVQDVGIYVLVPDQTGYYYYLALYDYLPRVSSDTYLLNKDEYMGVVYFCDGSCADYYSAKAFAPVYFLYQTPLNELVYITPVVAQVPTKNQGPVDIDGYLIMKFNPANNDFSIYFSVSPTSKLRLLIGKHINALKFKYIVFDSQGNPSQQTSSLLTFYNGFDIALVSLRDLGITPLMIVGVTDVSGNEAFHIPDIND